MLMTSGRPCTTAIRTRPGPVRHASSVSGNPEICWPAPIGQLAVSGRGPMFGAVAVHAATTKQQGQHANAPAPCLADVSALTGLGDESPRVTCRSRGVARWCRHRLHPGEVWLDYRTAYRPRG